MTQTTTSEHQISEDTSINHSATIKDDYLRPSERIGKNMWLWLFISFPFLWIGQHALLGLCYVIGEHLSLPNFLLAFVYGILFVQSSSDIYNSISSFVHNRNTLLGYLYALFLSGTNLGIWVMTNNPSYAPFIVLIMIGLGLITGRWTELQMKSKAYSERTNTYLKSSLMRTFPIDYTQTVTSAVGSKRFEILRTLPPRSAEECCKIRIHYCPLSSEAIVNVESELEKQFSICGLNFIMPFTSKRVLSSDYIDLSTLNEMTPCTILKSSVQTTAS